MSSNLDRLADECQLMIRTRALVDWVGRGRPVTPKGVLRPSDVPSAAVVLGVAVPARIRTAADVEVIHRPWVAAEALGLIQIGANRAVAVPVRASEADVLGQWWTAVAAVLRAESHDDRRCGATVLCRTLLTVLATEPPPEAADLADTVHELFHYADYREAGAVYEAFRGGVMPTDAGTELLAEIGAVDDHGRITALGRWLRERLVADMPPPVTPDLSASELLARLAGLPDDEVWGQSAKWLAERDLVKAADELLAAAAGAAPAERVVAVDVVAGLGEPAMPAWQRALHDPMLAPHARSVLAELQDSGDPGDLSEPDAADRLWLAVEYALVALGAEGPEEAYHLLRDLDSLDTLAGSGHPHAATLRAALADLVAAGGPPVSTYQLKITLSRVRPPVWRRVRLPATATLDALHQIIQVAFDWDDAHLHAFTADGRRYADPFFGLDGCADESRVRLGKLLPRPGGSMSYVYDMGDWWEHQITVERIIDTDAADETPTCVGGRGDAPVEDWYPDCGRNPTPFDLDAINRRLARLYVED